MLDSFKEKYRLVEVNVSSFKKLYGLAIILTNKMANSRINMSESSILNQH
jgi:hypothetical protein